jgi:hypothetical protein
VSLIFFGTLAALRRRTLLEIKMLHDHYMMHSQWLKHVTGQVLGYH